MTGKSKDGTKASEAAARRAARLAEQLRGNLKRRKAQAKTGAGSDKAPEEPSGSAS